VIEAVKRHRLEAQDRNEAGRVLSNSDDAPAPDELARDRNPHAVATAGLADAIDKVTLSRTQLEIGLSGSSDDEVTTATVVIRWTPSAFRRRRDIIQPTTPDTSHKRAMRARAWEAFASAIVDAHRWLDELPSNQATSIATLADGEHKSECSIRMTLSLAFLAPDLVKAAFDGKLPRGFNTTRLVDLPMLWSEQWSALGLQPPTGNRRAQAFAIGPRCTLAMPRCRRPSCLLFAPPSRLPCILRPNEAPCGRGCRPGLTTLASRRSRWRRAHEG
jgi:hypothetical protein